MSSDVADLARPLDAVPDGWRETTLGIALAKSESGGTPPRDVEAYWNGDIPWASVKDVVKGEGFAPEETITAAGLANSTSKLIPAGTNIFAARMGVGAVVRYPFPVAINQDLMAFTPSPDLDPGYLFYWLQARKAAFVAVATGTTVKGIRKDVLLSFPLSLPPLDEQRRIAEVLRSVDEAIAAAQDVVDQSKSNLEAATSKLMAAHHSLSDWRCGRCDSFFVLQRGFDITEAQATPGPYRVISSSGPSYSHSEFAVEGPAVITGRKGRLGTVFYSEEACWPHDTALWVKDFKGNHPRFVYWKLRQMDLKAYDAATSVPTLNRNNVHALEIAFPPIAEQIDISETLDAMLLAIDRAEAELVALQGIKSTISIDLLSGRVRVPA